MQAAASPARSSAGEKRCRQLRGWTRTGCTKQRQHTVHTARHARTCSCAPTHRACTHARKQARRLRLTHAEEHIGDEPVLVPALVEGGRGGLIGHEQAVAVGVGLRGSTSARMHTAGERARSHAARGLLRVTATKLCSVRIEQDCSDTTRPPAPPPHTHTAPPPASSPAGSHQQHTVPEGWGCTRQRPAAP